MILYFAMILFSDFAARIFNRRLRRDSSAANRLREHAGQAVAFRAGGFGLLWRIDGDGFLAAESPLIDPDAVAAASPSLLVKALADADGKPRFSKAVNISGDADLLKAVGESAENAAADCKESIRRLLGPSASGGISQAANRAIKLAGRGAAHFESLMRDYAENECGVFADRESIRRRAPIIRRISKRAERVLARTESLQ